MLGALRRRRPNRRGTQASPSSEFTGGDAAAQLQDIAAAEQRSFRYDVLVAATGGFSDEAAGSSGHAACYKGRLGDGREVAVTVRRVALRRGQDAAAEFVAAARALARVRHRNVAAVLGYCVHGGDALLVYERLPTGLHEVIFRPLTDRAVQAAGGELELDWPCRYGIILGVARGLAYLHGGANTAVVHGRIGPHSVLLDTRRVPKIVVDHRSAGLVAPVAAAAATELRVGADDRDGHTAPEYAMHGLLSPKADVYGFGVLVLEIVTGRDCSSPVAGVDGTFLEWAWRLHRGGKVLEAIDTALLATNRTDLDEVELCAHVALLCVQGDPKLRPDMERVVVGLSKKHHGTLEAPVRPGMLGVRYRRRRACTSPAAVASAPHRRDL